MTINEEYLKNKLINNLDAFYVSVHDESDGCGAKFNVIIVSDKFVGKTLLQRHRMVNEILTEELKEIHAFSQKTLTIEQWNNINKN
ncbi:bolA-like protein 2 [Daktulosphaira vitifoliae]|uniref:bolA-like protein 2 n=1 Tax=Daktulosphaira vitifoliae TaxID=58002 RepID=UPI0021AA435B|nr:bolA-like protein 2 [Daktulosphaira vitifoliae]